MSNQDQGMQELSLDEVLEASGGLNIPPGPSSPPRPGDPFGHGPTNPPWHDGAL